MNAYFQILALQEKTPFHLRSERQIALLFHVFSALSGIQNYSNGKD